MPSASRIRAIWACAREHGITREEVHDAIFAGWRANSVKDLADWQADALIRGMRGGKDKRKHIPSDRRSAMQAHGRKDDRDLDTEYLITEEERKLLWQAAFLRNMTGDTLRKFCRKMIGKDEPATVREYNKVFWAFKAMQRRDEKRAAVRAKEAGTDAA